MSFKIVKHFIIALLSVFLLGACTSEAAPTKDASQKNEEKQAQEQKIKFDNAVKEKNEELEQTPLEVSEYGEELGAILKAPTYDNFAVNQRFTVEGTIEKHAQLKGDFVWIKIQYSEDAISDESHEYYVRIKDGAFKQEVTLHDGEGKYYVKVLLPSKDQENYYYDLAKFDAFNVNPDIVREITYSPFAQNASLKIQQPIIGYLKENEIFNLTGTVDLKEDQDTIMIKITKDGDSWKHMLPVKNGEFTYNVPLFFGKGVHKLDVFVPDEERVDFFQEGTTIYIDNESERVMDPIDYTSVYEERGVSLESPLYGGDEANLTYRVQGTIEKDAPFAKETTYLYVTTKKDGEEALDVIPVNDYKFDDEFYLRFGPGTYDVTLSVPEIKEKNSAKFYYYHVAKFTVENTATEDQRDTLPSRGVQSDAPKIIAIADQLVDDNMSDREKAKAVYEYTAKTISYDVEKLRTDAFEWDDSALKVLELGTGVCQDYAYLAIALLRAADMEARYIYGTAGSGFNFSRHAWVEVKVDGEWLTMDPTWGAGYIDKNEFVAKYTEDYFEPSEEAFKTHSRTKVEY